MISIDRNLNNSVKKTLFSMTGRLNRVGYILFLIGVVLGFYLLAFFYGYNYGSPDISIISRFLVILLTLGQIYVLACLIIKRLHDMDLSGWFYWLLYIPLINIILVVVLLFIPGDQGPNRYGDPT